jgi:isopenicillin-N N-acyltransferase-like protein
MLLSVVVLISVFCAGLRVDGAYCNGSPADGERTNDYPIFDGKELTLTKSVKNAMLFEAGPENARFPIVHLWGTPYEVGFAQGTLLKKEMNTFIYELWAYLTTELVHSLPESNFPEAAIAKIVDMGMERALDWTAEQTKPFTPQAYFDELQGMADASGISYDLLYRINMFPELTKAQCSFFGAWGSAVAKENHAYQLRALDFDVDGPFKEYHQLTVYHPSEGHAFAQVSWPGNVGLLTGMSSQQIGVSEIGVSFPDDSFGQGTDNTPPEMTQGQPWMSILRDVLQFETSLEGAKQRVANANRTCNLVIGLGDGKKGAEESVNGVEFSGRVANFYADNTLLPVNETWHTPIEDVVYNGMDWLCPAYNKALGDQLRKYHGLIEEEVVVRNILPTVQTGNLHIAIYGLTESLLHLSLARKDGEDGPDLAYARQFTKLYMADIFAQAPPAETA